MPISEERISEVLRNPLRKTNKKEMAALISEIKKIRKRLDKLQSMHTALTGRPLHG